MRHPVMAAVLLLAMPAAATPWTVDPALSRIGFVATWAGKPVEGHFKRWSAKIDFDPARSWRNRVSVDIDLASVAMGDRTAAAALPESDWFGVTANPMAHFASTSITRVDAGNRWVAHGLLTMRGRSVGVDLPFTLQIRGDGAVIQGSTRVDRRSWAIGAKSDASAEYVNFGVPLHVTISAHREHDRAPTAAKR